MADDLWGLFDEDDNAEDNAEDDPNAATATGGPSDGAPQPQQQPSSAPRPSAQQSLPTGALAAEHPFFAQSKLWPPSDSPLDDLQVRHGLRGTADA